MEPRQPPPFTIAVVNSKGGVGKTTTAVALSHLLGDEAGPTMLLDLDRQGSATAWSGESASSGRPIASTVRAVPADTPPARLARLIAENGAGVEWLVIDTATGDPDRVDAAIEAVARNGGLVVIPTGDSPLDLPRAVVTMDDVDGRAPVVVLLTQTRLGTVSAREAPGDLVDAGADVLRSRVPLRESVKRAATDPAGFADLLFLYRPVVEELLGRAARS